MRWDIRIWPFILQSDLLPFCPMCNTLGTKRGLLKGSRLSAPANYSAGTTIINICIPQIPLLISSGIILQLFFVRKYRYFTRLVSWELHLN